MVGFYRINVGYVAFALRSSDTPVNLRQAIELVSDKLGVVLLVLGAMHFFNLFVFSRIRTRAKENAAPPPFAPDIILAPKAGSPLRYLTVIYDPDCGLCSRLGTWLLAQPKMLDLRMAPSSSLAQIYPELAARGLRHDLIVVSDDGAVYLGDHAWLMCLYALKRYRHWSQRLARPSLLPFARQAFKILSANRHHVSKWMKLLSDVELETELRNIHAPSCYGTNPQTTH